jgi:hypothetical protein
LAFVERGALQQPSSPAHRTHIKHRKPIRLLP